MPSLASSPIVPLATAILAGALIVGTSYGGNSDDAIASEDAADAAAAEVAAADAEQVEKDFAAANPPAAPAAPAAAAADAAAASAPSAPTVKCAGTSCTVVFPITGGTAKVFNTPFVMTKGFPSRGGNFTLGTKKVSASKANAGTAPGYTVTITKADATSITAVVAKA